MPAKLVGPRRPLSGSPFSEGISDEVDLETTEVLCRTHAADPQALADALVDAAEDDAEGYRNDASVIVLLRV
ncbi:hypothetical protein ACWEQ8_02500 [Streptomyces noursei]